jgi:hypothetical protein
MLRENRLQSPDFLALQLSLSNCLFQFRAKVAIILNGKARPGRLRMFGVDYREPFRSSDLTKYRIRRDKMINQFLAA